MPLAKPADARFFGAFRGCIAWSVAHFASRLRPPPGGGGSSKPSRGLKLLIDAQASISAPSTGSIVRGGGDASLDADPYRFVAVEPGMAWLRNSVETRVIKTGDLAPRLGGVAY